MTQVIGYLDVQYVNILFSSEDKRNFKHLIS